MGNAHVRKKKCGLFYHFLSENSLISPLLETLALLGPVLVLWVLHHAHLRGRDLH